MIRLAQPQDFDLIVALHSRVLSWSINARLGGGHVARLYRALLDGEDAFIIVDTNQDGTELFGFVSATTDPEMARRRIAAALDLRSRLRLLAGIAFSPADMIDAFESTFLIPRILRRHGADSEILTWLSLPNSPRGAKAASQCFFAAVEELSSRGRTHCHAQVMKSNMTPNRFHARAGNKIVATLIRNVIYRIDRPQGEIAPQIVANTTPRWNHPSP